MGAPDSGSAETGREDTAPVDSGDTDIPDSGSLAYADAVLVGEEAGDAAGWTVAAGGDVNGDGRDDLFIGAPHKDPAFVYLVLGPVTGEQSLSEADARLAGIGGAGWALAGAGDVDGDGYDDLTVGGPGAGPDTEGTAWLLLGPVSGDGDLSTSDAILIGGPREFAGSAVAGPGDVDGDGWGDLIVGAYAAQGRTSESYAGHCADLDVDDYGSEEGYLAGAAYLVYGPVTGERTLPDADLKLIGEDGGDYAGSAVASLGDFDGDGLADLYVSAEDNCEGGTSAGAAYVVEGPVIEDLYLDEADLKLVGESDSDQAGEAIAAAGDVNGDGSLDLLVGAPDKRDGPGDRGSKVYLLLGYRAGVVDLATADASLWGETYNYAGEALSSLGDLNLDGFDDLLVGAGCDSSAGFCAGATYAVLGPISGTGVLDEGDGRLLGVEAGDEAGAAVVGTGDIDGDGVPDLGIGAFAADNGEADAGAIYVVLGAGSLLASVLSR